MEIGIQVCFKKTDMDSDIKFKMKISICIPQYNRIKYLLKSLSQIESQEYTNIEIVISDDGSTDETELEIIKLQSNYKFPIIYHKNEINLGYDRNYRKSMELASGDYCIVIGNDDSIYEPISISFLSNFLRENDFPDIGFSNFVEDNAPGVVVHRAQLTGVLGSGSEIAIKYYSCFSFVGGLIYKRSSFNKYNTGKYDGSIYSQIYLGCLMIADGCRLFSVKEPLILKDIYMNGEFHHSYRDRIAKNWEDYHVVDGGMPSVINVVINALQDANVLSQVAVYKIFSRIYSLTYPHWILDYKSNGALPEAVGLTVGMSPSKNKNFSYLNFTNKMRIYFKYLFSTFIGFITPVIIFKKLKNTIYQLYKK